MQYIQNHYCLCCVIFRPIWTTWPYGMERLAGQMNLSPVFTQACPTKWHHKLLTDACHTLIMVAQLGRTIVLSPVIHNGSVFAVRFS